MKIKIITLNALLLASCLSHGQGTFIYDQQSWTNDTLFGNSATQVSALGQSFTPSLPTVGFIRLYLGNGVPVDPGPGTLHVNLRADSMTGVILGSTQPQTLSPGFYGPVTFIFSTPVPVTPVTTYYMQPVVDIGVTWDAGALLPSFNYPGGMLFASGIGIPSEDLWFREGILVPEPSAPAILALVAALLALRHRSRR